MQTGSLVNAGLLKSSLTRFWPLWLIDIFTWLLVYVASLVAMLSAASPEFMSGDQMVEARLSEWGAYQYMGLVIVLVGAIIVAVSLNERLFVPKAATFYGALPVRRDTLFATSLVAGLLPQLAVEAVVAVVLAVICSSMDGLSAVLVLDWFGLMAGTTLVMYALATAACQLSGSSPVAVFLYFLANILAVCVVVAVQLVATGLMYGVSWDFVPLDWAAPIVGIAHYCLSFDAGTGNVPQTDWLALGGYCLFGVALLVLAAWLNRRRDMEHAADAVAFNGLRPVLKYLAGICGALLMGAFIYLCMWLSERGYQYYVGNEGVILLAMGMAAGAFLGVLFAQMVISRSTHVLGSVWKGGAILAAASVLLVGALHIDVLGIASKVPEVVDVQHVELLGDYNVAGTFESEGGIESVRSLHRQFLEYGNALADGSESLGGAYEEGGNYGTVVISYHLKNGQELERTYRAAFRTDDDGNLVEGKGVDVLKATQAVANSQEAKRSRLAWLLDEDSPKYQEKFWVTLWHDEAVDEESHSTGLSAKQAADFAQNALTPDALEGGAFDVDLFWGTETTFGYDASIEVTGPQGETLAWYQLDKQKTPNTIAWVKKNLPNVKLHEWTAEDGRYDD